MKTICVLMVIFSLFFCGCKEKKQSSNEPTSSNVVSSQSQKDTADLTDVAAHNTNTNSSASALDEMPNFHIGDTVTLEGEFLGWNASKAGCKNQISSPPVTRSDWILKISGKFCIYVTGHVPAGVDKLSPKGEKIKVTGTIKQTESGQIYLYVNN